jgi:hypothetical protein
MDLYNLGKALRLQESLDKVLDAEVAETALLKHILLAPLQPSEQVALPIPRLSIFQRL